MRSIIALPVALMLVAPAAANQVTLSPTCQQSICTGFCSIYGGQGSIVVIDDDLDCVPEAVSHVLLQFDLASQIPQGSHLNSATLTFTITVFTGGVIELRPLLNSWTCPTLTWVGPSTGYGAPVGPFLATGGSTTHPVIMSSNALTALLQTWVDQPALTTGLMVLPSLGCQFVEEYMHPCCPPQVMLIVDFDPPCLPAPTSYCVAAPNSAGFGAHISILGSTRISDNAMTVVVHQLRPGAPGFFFFGGAQQQTPFGNGFLCVDAPLYRLLPGLFSDAAGTISRPVDFTVGSALNITAGSVWNFQIRYRDAAGGGAGFNSSDGVRVTFCP